MINSSHALLKSNLTEMEIGSVASEFTPADIRCAIAELVAENSLVMADALSAAGLSLYPKSEDVLAISALLAQMRGDWVKAEDLYFKLLDVQGDSTTAFTLWQLVRVQRCLCDPFKAIDTVEKALIKYPNDSNLKNEFYDLMMAFEVNIVKESSEKIQ